MTKKLFAMVVIVSVACIASATPSAWFNGGLGSDTKVGGDWQNASQSGVTLESNKYVLDDPESPLIFAATDAKLPEGTNLNFAVTANFKYSYDELPSVDAGAKAGIVVYTNCFYVLGRDGANPSNIWKKTAINAGTVDTEVSVSVAVTNGNDKTFALYTIGDASVIEAEVYVSSAAKSWNQIACSGSGVVASLAGTYEQLGYPSPSGNPIPGDKADKWASDNYPGATKAEISTMLASSQEYNGRTAAESCILGVKTNAVITASVVDTNAAVVTFAVNCSPISGRATFTLKKDGSAVGDGRSAPNFEFAIADGVYTIVASIDGANKEIPVSQQIGVKGTAVTASKVSYIGAPWDECPVTNLLKKTGCAEGDKLEVLNPEACTNYYTWTFTSGRWQYVPSAQLESEPALTLKKGQAVKYTAAATGTRYEIGNVSTATSTAITAGVNKWNLIAKPSGGELSPADIPLDNNQARAVVLNDTGTAPTNVFMKIKDAIYVGTGWNGPWTEVSNEKITGGFFLKTKDATSVSW